MKTWNIEMITGYKPKTTFYEDFSIADCFGEAAIKDTFNRAWKSWRDNIEYLTELIMVLNWKIWEHLETNKQYANLYQYLYMYADAWVFDNITGEDLQYYYNTTN